MPVEKFERETTIGIAQFNGSLHDFLVGFIGKDNPHPERIEEADK